MKKFDFWAVLAVTVLGTMPFASAKAQDGKQSFDQYPSFIELSASGNEGTQSVMRCGYMLTGGQNISPDTGFREISVMNKDHKSYSRIQRIDNYLIATSIDPAGGPGFLMELVSPDGSTKAKSCQIDPGSDMIANCKPIQPFTFADQVKAGDDKIGTQCGDLLRQGSSQINPSLADPQKTEQFKAGLRQKVNILASP